MVKIFKLIQGGLEEAVYSIKHHEIRAQWHHLSSRWHAYREIVLSLPDETTERDVRRARSLRRYYDDVCGHDVFCFMTHLCAYVFLFFVLWAAIAYGIYIAGLNVVYTPAEAGLIGTAIVAFVLALSLGTKLLDLLADKVILPYRIKRLDSWIQRAPEFKGKKPSGSKPSGPIQPVVATDPAVNTTTSLSIQPS